MKIKAIIFDWGRTLFDMDTENIFPDSEHILEYCKEKGYKMCVASLARRAMGNTPEKRKNQILNSILNKYFDFIEVSEKKEKDNILDSLVEKLNMDRKEILIVDDRVIKSIKYGNTKGHPTVWLKRGLFENELPNEETKNPSFIIKSLLELKDIV